MWKFVCCLVVVLNALVHSVSAAEAPRTSHALLIGISDYSSSDGVKSLMGRPDDLAFMRDVLKARFGVKDENIVTLMQR